MFDIVVIAASDDPVRKRVQEMCNDFAYSLGQIDNVDAFVDNETATKCEFIICSATQVKLKSEIAGIVQVVRQFATEAFIIMIVDGKMPADTAQFVKQSGASLILLELDAVNSAKLDLIASQKIKYKYLPVKAHELKADTKVSCDIYHMMPLNGKYLKIMRKGDSIGPEKHKKIAECGEVYVRKEEANELEAYMKANQDMSAMGAAARCRAQLMQLTTAYIDLILMVLDQSEHTSYALGKELYLRVQKMSSDLLISLGSVEEPWDIINNTAIGDSGSVERGPSIAAYAGLLSLNGGVGDATEVMISALLMDVGLLDIDPNIIRKIRNNREESFTTEEREEYQKHPITSIHRVLGRKLPVTETIKKTILGSHESFDGKGFPHNWRPDQIPEESLLVKLAEIIDKASLIKMGKERPKIKDVRVDIINREFATRERFSLDFMQKVRPYLLGQA